MSEAHRFQDPGVSVYAFGATFWVECPRCGACAVVRAGPEASEAAVTCRGCGYARRGEQRHAVRHDAFDWYFGLPLWLQTRCCGEVLWARNPEHLAFLEAYLSARLRERPRDADPAWYRNKGMASRLPLWMKSAKNRQEVARCLEKLRKKAAGLQAGTGHG